MCAPMRAGKRHNLTSCIKKRIAEFSSTAVHSKQEAVNQPKRKTSSSSSMLAQAVAAKLEEGNLKAAIRILVSDDTPSMPSVEGLAKLKQKHPPATLMADSLPQPQPDSFLSVIENDVRKAVTSFPAGSAGGPDGIRPQHIKDLMNCRETGADFLTALTSFVNMLLAVQAVVPMKLRKFYLVDA